MFMPVSKESCDRTKTHFATISDRALVDYLRRQRTATVSDLVDRFGVTATAVRQRLTRLMKQGLVFRESEPAGRGRPTHQYSLTRQGVRTSGNNYEDLAGILWSEVRAVQDPVVRRGLLQRIVRRLAEEYRENIAGSSLPERMTSLVELMGQRDIPFEIHAIARESGPEEQLPVLTALACPYPDLAEQDRAVCAMEKMLFSEVLGSTMRLTACRLDGDNCCTFEPSSVATAIA